MMLITQSTKGVNYYNNYYFKKIIKTIIRKIYLYKLKYFQILYTLK